MASILYNFAKGAFLKGTIPWDTSGTPIRILLIKSTYSPDPDHVYVSDLTPGTNEVSGAGYVRKDLSSRTVTVNNTTDRAIATAANPLWTALDCGTIAAAVVYLQVGGDDATPADDVLIAYLDYNDLVTNGGDVTLQWPATGMFYYT